MMKKMRKDYYRFFSLNVFVRVCVYTCVCVCHTKKMIFHISYSVMKKKGNVNPICHRKFKRHEYQSD